VFRKNTKHQQPELISAASELPEKQRRHLEKSWADTFYHQFFLRINKEAFSVLHGVQEVGGANPLAPTKNHLQKKVVLI